MSIPRDDYEAVSLGPTRIAEAINPGLQGGARLSATKKKILKNLGLWPVESLQVEREIEANKLRGE